MAPTRFRRSPTRSSARAGWMSTPCTTSNGIVPTTLIRLDFRFFSRKRSARAGASEIRAFFNRAAADEEHYPSAIDPRIYHVKLVLDHIAGTALERVADIGCGKGRFARIVKERFPRASVIAVDLAEAMLARVPEGIQRVAASMTALPIASDSCDAVYATESLEHAIDIPAAVAEL